MSAPARPVPVDTVSSNVQRKPARTPVSTPEPPVAANDAAQTPAPKPQPSLPPGAMFIAAIVAGALSPVPETPRELQMRIGQSWTPPESELRLRDRTV